MLPACGNERDEDDPSRTEIVERRLDNRGDEPGRAVSSLAAELSGDGKNYCAVGRRNLCAPARFSLEACQDPDGSDGCSDQRRCVCCSWVPGYPVIIRCWEGRDNRPGP
jgi:hypothetical protein